jgi:hypothetical protein
MHLFQKRKIHFIGDSHTEVFKYMFTQKSKYKFSNFSFNFCIVPGATNMGLSNPNSKTEAMPIFKTYLKKVQKKDISVLMLGEVDCGFVIWYRAEKMAVPIETQFETSLNNYKELIYNIHEIIGNNIIICSVPLPTIKDGEQIGQVANERMGIKATQKERTALTIKYNRELKKLCSELNILYLDSEKETLDDNSGTVAEMYLSKRKDDHHLSNETLSEILYPKLKFLLKSIK